MTTMLMTYDDLTRLGLSNRRIQELLTTGDLERLQRGVFVPRRDPAATPEARHIQLVHAVLACLSCEPVVSHLSAAAVHGLPIWGPELPTVHLSRARLYGGRTRPGLALHGTRLSGDQVTSVDGIAVTTLARTVVDVLRTGTRRQAIVAGDAALTAGLSPVDLASALADAKGWPGVRQARAISALLDGNSESPGESVSRLLIVENLLPSPRLQEWIHDHDGGRIGRVDFCWPDQRVVGEFDGRQKYATPFAPDTDVVDVVLAEKSREDAIREQGWQVVRWTGEDLGRPEQLVRRLRRALGLACWPVTPLVHS